MNGPPLPDRPALPAPSGPFLFCPGRAEATRKVLRLLALTLLLSALLCGRGSAAGNPAAGPRWTIGRGEIVSRQPGYRSPPLLYLRVSLRNLGSPGRLPITIYGRWRRRPAPRIAPGSLPTRGGGIPGNARDWRPGGERPDPPPRPAAGTPRRWQLPKPGRGAGRTSAWAAPSASRTSSRMRLLGRYRREVSLVRTAILEVPLRALGRPQRDVAALELLVMTANRVTGRGRVALRGVRP